MSSILDLLMQQAGGGDLVGDLSRQLGADRETTSRAVSGALPALLGALANNAGETNGANALASALDRDHDGGILGDLGGFLSQGDTSLGEGILKHVLGGQRSSVESRIGQSSGLDASMVAKLLPLLAPIVMGMLGQQKRERGLDAGGLSEMLAGERSHVERQAPGMLGKLLDADGDGDATDDLLRAGTSLLGGLFGGR